LAIELKPNHTDRETHSVMPIPFKAHKVNWLSAELLEAHFENHYGAEVRQLNLLEREFAAVGRSTHSATHITELREAIWIAAHNIALHESYFNSVGDISEQLHKYQPTGELAKSIEYTYGSIRDLFAEIVNLSVDADQATQWIVLAWSDRIKQLSLILVAHKDLAVTTTPPIMAINLQHYAFNRDFGDDLIGYVSAFLQCIHWGRVNDQFNRLTQTKVHRVAQSTANSITVTKLQSMAAQQNNSPLVLDVRHLDDCERYRYRITDTQWRDSFDVSSWSNELPKDKPIVVYCMYGFWVSQDVATELRAQGYDARTLIGGINSWRAMGYESTPI